MAMATAGQTTHFMVQYDDATAGAFLSAQGILSVCESNFDTLNALLPIPPGEKTPGGLPPFTGLVPILVEVVAIPSDSLGRNFGYSKTKSSMIQVSQTLPVASAQQVLAAELAELFMGFHRWTRTDSQGEALSVVCRDELYRFPFDVRVNNWLSFDAVRANLVATVWSTDSEPLSYGCGVLFINYLHYQLGYPFSAICQANGVTLTDRYRSLTGKSDDGFEDFRNLLQKHLPLEQGPYTLPTDNPFPLYEEPNQRSISPSYVKHTYTKIPVHFGPPRKVHISPFFTCPEADYSFRFEPQKDRAQIEVSVIGFAQPKFQWQIDTLPLPPVVGTLPMTGGDSISVALDRPDPAHPDTPEHKTGTLTFNFSISNKFAIDSMSSVLTIENVNHDGTYHLNVKVTISEAQVDLGENSLTQSVKLETLKVVYEGAYYDDQRRCEKAFYRNLNKPGLLGALDLVKTLPDPPSPDALNKIVQAILTVQAELRELHQRDPNAAKSLAQYAASILHVSPAALDSSV